MSVAIKLNHVSKKYLRHSKKPVLIEQITTNSLEFWAIKNLDLTINQGDHIGILGPNGSGKTTLLKIISGITTPTSGTIKTKGKVVSLIDLTAGFLTESSGLENARLQLSLMTDFDQKQKELALKKIIEFAEIGDFINEPIFTYSSGMIMRLAFAVITVLNADIYLIDEYISVGDTNFRDKCVQFFHKLRQQNKTIIAASHDLSWLLKFCNATIVLEKGVIATPQIIPANYLEFYRKSIQKKAVEVEIISNSMSPLINRGDTVKIRRKSFDQIKVGDVIAFIFPNYCQTIAHRVIALGRENNQTVLITKGDANEAVDPWIITKTEYIGQVSI